jgi:hypothetical protein
MGLTFASNSQRLTLCKTRLTEATRSHTLPYVNHTLRLTYTHNVNANPRFQGQRFGFSHPGWRSGRHFGYAYAGVKYLALSLLFWVRLTVTSRGGRAARYALGQNDENPSSRRGRVGVRFTNWGPEFG